jgi:hypothetical protein
LPVKYIDKEELKLRRNNGLASTGHNQPLAQLFSLLPLRWTQQVSAKYWYQLLKQYGHNPEDYNTNLQHSEFENSHESHIGTLPQCGQKGKFCNMTLAEGNNISPPKT